MRKKYLLLTDRAVQRKELVVESAVVRVGERYCARPPHTGSERAETRFRVAGSEAGRTLLEAQPITGKTHQIRVHMASLGHPVVGDTLYGAAREIRGKTGGNVSLPRNFLHAAEMQFAHPHTGKALSFACPIPEQLSEFLLTLEANPMTKKQL